jgi:hypothetical protein
MSDRYDDTGLSKVPSRNLQAKQFGGRQTAEEHDPEMDSFFAPLSHEDTEEIHQRVTGGDQTQRAGQMKRAYHQQQKATIAQQNKPPAQPRATRSAKPPQKTSIMKGLKFIGSLSGKANGRRR